MCVCVKSSINLYIYIINIIYKSINLWAIFYSYVELLGGSIAMISIASSIRPWAAPAAPGRDVTELPEVMGEYSWITGKVTFGKCFFTWSLETQWLNLAIEESLFPKAERDCKQQRLQEPQARMGKQKAEQQPSTEILPKNKVQNTKFERYCCWRLATGSASWFREFEFRCEDVAEAFEACGCNSWCFGAVNSGHLLVKSP